MLRDIFNLYSLHESSVIALEFSVFIFNYYDIYWFYLKRKIL